MKCQDDDMDRIAGSWQNSIVLASHCQQSNIESLFSVDLPYNICQIHQKSVGPLEEKEMRNPHLAAVIGIRSRDSGELFY